ncbi:MAG: Ig-like domain-containing protein [Angustibacter sp.]
MAPQLIPSRPGDCLDRGFTLIEVVVGVVLMAVVLLTAAGFMIRSASSADALDARQAAVGVARQQMEKVRAVPATFPRNGTSALVAGRSRDDVVAQWQASGFDTSQTYTGDGATRYDERTYTLASGSSVSPVVKLREVVTVSGQPYTVDTLIGTCTRQRTSGTCDKSGTGDQLYRVVVTVSWSLGAGRTCSGTACSYTLATLIDPTQQPTFNTQRRPIAVDDPTPGDPPITAVSGDPTAIAVLGNDDGAFPPADAVLVSGQPAHGTVVAVSGTNAVSYTSDPTFSGTDTFSYTVTDTKGLRSDAATVTVTVRPTSTLTCIGRLHDASTSYSYTPPAGALAGTGPFTLTFSGPSSPSWTGTQVTWTTPSRWTGSTNSAFTYTVTDAAGMVSDPITLVMRKQPC